MATTLSLQFKTSPPSRRNTISKIALLGLSHALQLRPFHPWPTSRRSTSTVEIPAGRSAPRVFGLKRDSSRSIRAPVHVEVIFAIWVERTGSFEAWVPYGVISENLTPNHLLDHVGVSSKPTKGVIPSRPDVGRQGLVGEQMPIGSRLKGQVNGEWQFDRLGELRLRTAAQEVSRRRCGLSIGGRCGQGESLPTPTCRIDDGFGHPTANAG